MAAARASRSIGAGAWGTTLARLVARAEPVTLVCHSPATAARIRETGRNEARLPGVDLPATVIATADPEALAAATDLVVFAAPSAHLRATTAPCAPYLAATADLVSVVKGLERGTLLRMSEVIAEASGLPSGPHRRAVGSEPGRRGRAQPAGVGGGRRRRTSSWRVASSTGSGAGGSGCT